MVEGKRDVPLVRLAGMETIALKGIVSVLRSQARHDRSNSVGWTAARSVKWRIWSRHENPGATMTVSGSAWRTVGKSRRSPTSRETS